MAPLQKRGKIVRPDSVDELVNTYEGDGRGVAWLPIGPIPFWSFCWIVLGLSVDCVDCRFSLELFVRSPESYSGCFCLRLYNFET